MVQGPSLDTLEALRNPSSLETQLAALKQLKDDIVGHDQRKELVVKQGVVEPLVSLIAVSSKATGKRRITETNGTSTHGLRPAWTPEEEARLQAILILGSLAAGGPAFVPPLVAADTPKHLFQTLEAESAPKLTTAILQAVKNLATSASASSDPRERIQLGIVDMITAPFSAAVEEALEKQTTSSYQRLKLLLETIACIANDEESRVGLAEHGVLETLAYLLVSYTTANKHVDYRGQLSKYTFGPSTKIIPDVLSAISNIISDSHYRSQLFILSPDVYEMMSNSLPINNDSRFTFGSRTGYQSPIEGLLPQLHVPSNKSVSFNSASKSFPALASLQSAGDRTANALALQQGSDRDQCNAVVMWLLFFARSMQGKNRMIALRLLAQVNHSVEHDNQISHPRSDSTQRSKEREFTLSMLAVPLAVQFVQIASDGRSQEPTMTDGEYLSIKEQACEVLALLIKGSKDLQNAAVDAGAAKRVCPALKKTFDSVPIAKPMWSARPSSATAEALPSCQMGSRGLPPEIQHLMRRRETALRAVAAIAEINDSHRKSILDAGVASCIIDSLKPFPPDYLTSPASNRDKITPKDGNTIPVILASCDAARAMSRSVPLLRTSLIDAGIAKPMFALLKHQNLEVQIAATDVCCNLVLEFSPMKEDLMNAGAIKTLTEHVRQNEMKLRLASLWALKHLVYKAPKSVKTSCLEELGPGWLVGAIEGEHKDLGTVPVAGGVSIGGLSTPNAAGEQVDLLNPASMDVDDPPEASRASREQDEDGEVMYDEASSTHYQASQLRSTLSHPLGAQGSSSFDVSKYLSAIREMEQNPTLLAKRDDIAVQEQALDFIRNMLTYEDCATMFEHLLEQIGSDKIFHLLNDKLSPALDPIPSSLPTSKPHQIFQPTELILATIHILSHIANGSPKHKQLLIAQKTLLQNWLPHFSHPDRRVRVVCVWTVINLTWIEEESDRPDARKRVQALQACGIQAAVAGLANDPDLDVRERVRTAVRQMDGL